MAVDDYGIEAIRKSAEEVIPGNKSNYYLKVGFASAFGPPASVDSITVNYPTDTQEVYEYRTGGISGTIAMTITIEYLDECKDSILSVVKT